MTELALHLTEQNIPHVPVRQFVLSLPHRLRYLLAYDHARSLVNQRCFYNPGNRFEVERYVYGYEELRGR